jgi:hypothetical protein
MRSVRSGPAALTSGWSCTVQGAWNHSPFGEKDLSLTPDGLSCYGLSRRLASGVAPGPAGRGQVSDEVPARLDRPPWFTDRRPGRLLDRRQAAA